MVRHVMVAVGLVASPAPSKPLWRPKGSKSSTDVLATQNHIGGHLGAAGGRPYGEHRVRGGSVILKKEASLERGESQVI
jgi:hypothetical protein